MLLNCWNILTWLLTRDMPYTTDKKELVCMKIQTQTLVQRRVTIRFRWVIYTGNSPVLVVICTIDMTFVICTADHLIQILILMTVKSFLIFTTCLKKCSDTTYICLLITITHGRHILLIHSTHIKLIHTQQTADFWASLHTHQAYYVLMNYTHHTHTFLFRSTPMKFWYI